MARHFMQQRPSGIKVGDRVQVNTGCNGNQVARIVAIYPHVYLAEYTVQAPGKDPVKIRECFKFVRWEGLCLTLHQYRREAERDRVENKVKKNRCAFRIPKGTDGYRNG